MKILEIILVFCCQEILGKSRKNKERKLMFSPYLNVLDAGFAAHKLGQKPQIHQQTYMYAQPVGTKPQVVKSELPYGFSGGYTVPGTTINPYSHLGYITQNTPQNTEGGPVSTALKNPFHPGMFTKNNEGVFDLPGKVSPGFPNLGAGQGSQGSEGSSNYSLRSIRVQEKCDSVKRQAVLIANKVLNQQYSKMFEFLRDYLKRNKYVVGMTEVRLTKALRQDIYQIMSAFQGVQIGDISFSTANSEKITEADISKILEDIEVGESVEQERPDLDKYVPKI